MNNSQANATMSRQVIAASSSLLAAVWIVAMASIPGAQSYRDQLAAGTVPDKIVTPYDALTVIVPITMIGAWIISSRWLGRLHDAATANNPTAIRRSRRWVIWGWIVPVVSLWFPKNLIDDLLKTTGSEEAKKLIGKDSMTWWLTWIGYALVNNFSTVAAFDAPSDYVPIRPEIEIAAACLMTGSYLVWIRIVRVLGSFS